MLNVNKDRKEFRIELKMRNIIKLKKTNVIIIVKKREHIFKTVEMKKILSTFQR